MREAFIRAEGISGAVKKLSEILNLSSAEADRAWRMNTIPKMDGMNGERVDCTSEKKRALTEHVNSIIGKLLNSNDPYRERTKNIILSGGGAKDDLVFQVLKREVEIDGLYKLHKISDLPFKNENCSDPSLTCVMGLLEKGDLGLDVGNSFLKGAYI
jgi:hypothetical protein